MSFWSGHFGWPAGDVYGNLIASAIATGAATSLVWWRARVHLLRQAQKHAEQHARTHALLKQLHEHLGVDMPEENQT